MSTVFGDRDDFAIEAGVEPDSHTEGIVWGHMCVWCRGVPLGKLWERYCALYPAYYEFAWLADNLGRLWADELDGLDDVAAWNFLDERLYGYHGDVEVPETRSLAEMRRDSQRWRRFNFLLHWGEQFDGYKSFLLCPPGENARVLSRRLPAHSGRGVGVTRQCITKAAADFVRWFEGESSRLGVTCFSPRWLTEVVVALGSAIRGSGAFDRLPVLADALEEAGCDDHRLLADCRDPDLPPARGRGLLDSVLGYE